VLAAKTATTNPQAVALPPARTITAATAAISAPLSTLEGNRTAQSPSSPQSPRPSIGGKAAICAPVSTAGEEHEVIRGSRCCRLKRQPPGSMVHGDLPSMPSHAPQQWPRRNHPLPRCGYCTLWPRGRFAFTVSE
jgi:hypothetical protein